jgi:predicted amidohydrolase YtcJ
VKEFVEKNSDKEVYYTFGWDNVAMLDTKEKIEMKSKLDEICKDKVMLIVDNSGHNAFFNSKAAEVAGITKDTQIVGGVLSKGEDGELLGLASDMAMNYLLKHAVATKQIIQKSDYEGIAKAMEKTLHSFGYTYYQDGWTNYFGTQLLDALSEYDKSTGLSVVIAGTYKIDSYDDWKAELTKAKECSEKYPTNHFKYNAIKLFADGESVEGKSGWLIDGYKDGTHGTQVWDDETMNAIVKAANEAGISLHIHSQGDAATRQVVNAYINAESVQKGGIYNGICHGRNITEDSKKKMGEHHIYVAENINWRVLTPKDKEDMIEGILDMSLFKAGYPIKSLIDNGVLVTSSTDVPAASGAPTTVTGIIEVAVNDTRGDFEVVQHNESERVSVEQAMDILTINGAKQLQMEKERGSIEIGKYADFIFINKDISTCAKDTIHEGEVETVYFEGKEVYTV